MDHESINYLSEPEKYSNCCVINLSMINEFCDLIDGKEVDADDVILLSALTQSIVLNESIIIEDDILIDLNTINDFTDSLSVSDFIRLLDNDNIVDNLGSGESMLYQGSLLANCDLEPVKISFIHDSNILIERDDKYAVLDFNYFSHDDFTHPNSFNAHLRHLEYCKKKRNIKKSKWDKKYFDTIQNYGYHLSEYGDSPIPWKLLSNCHGIPYLSDSFYSERGTRLDAPTNIGYELYAKLEKLHQSYFSEVKKYLGPTYVYIPPLVSILLKECRTSDDIPFALLNLRREFCDLRKKCTNLEIELRNAKKLKDQVAVIKEIESAYNGLKIKTNKPNYRLLMRLFDIVKRAEPVQMGIEMLSQIRDVIVEEDGLIKIPGYYNLWQASLDAEQGLPLLERIFRNRLSPSFIVDMHNLMKEIGEQPSCTNK